MKTWLFRLLQLMLLLGLIVTGPAQAWQMRGKTPPIPAVKLADLPPEAHATLALIHKGGPFPFKRDGITFENREYRLPPQPRGYYHEYTVSTPGAGNRGARRLIAGEGAKADVRISGEYYYSDDHYKTFSKVVE